MYRVVLDFWFGELKPAQWWKKDEDLDRVIVNKFSGLHYRATRCELFEWRKEARGRLAEIIILDQFSRNMYRGSPLSFAYDALALALAQEAVSIKADESLNQGERGFLYMPYMHSESLEIHQIATELFHKNGNQNSLDFELKHRAIIERFGRYPHRNSILGRESSDEEIEFLKQPGSGF